MKNRKTHRANIEKTIPFFFRIGLIASITITIVAFEWRTPIAEEMIRCPGTWTPTIDEEIIPVTFQTEKKLELPKENEKIIDVKTEPIEPVIIDKPDKQIIQPEISISDLGNMKIPEPEPEVPFVYVPEIKPQFPGGIKALEKYLQKNINYPLAARDINLTGIVYITFTVSSNGEIKDPVISKDIGGGCGKEAIRVIKKMPNWIPGQQGGLAVNVPVTLPLNFGLIK